VDKLQLPFEILLSLDVAQLVVVQNVFWIDGEGFES
jgi:hypothetical protein